MIVLERVAKFQQPYREKYYRAVVELDLQKRALRRRFRRAMEAELYARRVIDRYKRVVIVGQRAGESGAPGNNAERMPA